MNPPRDTGIEDLARSLGPYARFALARSADFARRLHAEKISPEHVLASLLQDEECGATRLVLHAFADPATLGVEVLALCTGIMVVRSGGTLPFSVRAVPALEHARRLAWARGEAEVSTTDVATAAWHELPAGPSERLKALAATEAPDAEDAEPEGPLFRTFTADARRALASAARKAVELGRPSISPAHLVLGALEIDEDLRQRSGLTPAGARLALAGNDEDATPFPDRTLTAAPELVTLVEALPAGAGTAAILGWLLSHGTEEIRSLLSRQRITPALYAKAGSAFQDPAPPA